ncbi:MAG: hypothetical protein J6S96_09500 [Muribaculaceae bacterium]|nr:hypothetical protein [Muribaculaceae bacterium]
MKFFKFYFLLAIVMMTMLSFTCQKTATDTSADISTVKPQPAIEKLNEDQLKSFVALIDQHDRNADGLLLLQGADYFVSKASNLSVEQMESFVELLQETRKENDSIVALSRRADVSLDGGLEAVVNTYSKNPEKTFENFKKRMENDNKYSMLISTFQKQIEINKEKEYAMPEGDLVFYSHRVSGGMMRGTNYEIQKKSDGKTYLTTNANFRDMEETTIMVPDTALVHIQKIIADYKMYELAPLYVTPFMVYDAPSTFISAKFSSGQQIKSDGQQSAPHNKGVWVICDYLSSLAPKPEQ